MEACGACYPTMSVSFPPTVSVQAGATQSDPFSVSYLGDEGNGIFYASYGASEITKSFGFKYPWPYNAAQVESGALTVGGTVHIKIQIDYPAGPEGATVSIVKQSGACDFSAADGAVQPGAFDGVVTVTGLTAGFCPVRYYVTGTGYTDHYIAGSVQVFAAP